jgi:hypothetical protein
MINTDQPVLQSIAYLACGPADKIAHPAQVMEIFRTGC